MHSRITESPPPPLLLLVTALRSPTHTHVRPRGSRGDRSGLDFTEAYRAAERASAEHGNPCSGSSWIVLASAFATNDAHTVACKNRGAFYPSIPELAPCSDACRGGT